MSTQHHDQERGKRRTRSLVLVLLAWVFIGGQGLLAAGNVYNYQRADKSTADKAAAEKSLLPWQLMGQGR